MLPIVSQAQDMLYQFIQQQQKIACAITDIKFHSVALLKAVMPTRRRERQQGIFRVSDIPCTQPLSFREWNADAGTFSSPRLACSCEPGPNRSQVDVSYHVNADDESFDLPAGPFEWELDTVQVNASPEILIENALPGNVNLVEHTEDGQVVFILPAHLLRQGDSMCDTGLDAIPRISYPNMRCSDRCPFVLLRIRLFTFSGGGQSFLR
jgi:hypothetical protein